MRDHGPKPPTCPHGHFERGCCTCIDPIRALEAVFTRVSGKPTKVEMVHMDFAHRGLKREEGVR